MASGAVGRDSVGSVPSSPSTSGDLDVGSAVVTASMLGILTACAVSSLAWVGILTFSKWPAASPPAFCKSSANGVAVAEAAPSSCPSVRLP